LLRIKWHIFRSNALRHRVQECRYNAAFQVYRSSNQRARCVSQWRPDDQIARTRY